MKLFQNSNVWQNSAKIFIVPTFEAVTGHQANFLFYLFNTFGLVNSAIISSDNNLTVYTSDLFSNVFKVIDGRDSIENVFTDKLKNCKGFELKVLIGPQVPRIRIKNGTFSGVDLEVLKITASKLNLRLKLVEFDFEADWLIDLQRKLFTREAHLTLITMASFEQLSTWRQVYPNDENGYCALAPIPPRLSFLHFLMTPFDAFTWLCLILSTIGSALLWKFMGKTFINSAWVFGFAVIANFFGQSVKVSNSRALQVTLLQLCILMTFIMGNAYQSLIVATMTFSRDGH